MEPTSDRSACAEFADDLGVLAVGALSGRERASVLAHVERCPVCEVELESLSAGADALVALYPEREPDEGFADRVMARITADRATSRRRLTGRTRVALAVGAAGLVALVGGLTAAAVHHDQPDHGTLATAALASPSGVRGKVSLISADGNWLVMTLDDARATGTVTCRVVLSNGSTRDIGRFALRDGYGSWVVPLPVAPSTIEAVRIVDDHGGVVASASL